MSETVFTAGSLVTNEDPMRRIQVFVAIPLSYATLEEAVEGVKDYYRLNFAEGARVPFEALTFTVYASGDGNAAFVEVGDGGGLFRNVGLFKVVKVKWVDPNESGRNGEG